MDQCSRCGAGIRKDWARFFGPNGTFRCQRCGPFNSQLHSIIVSRGYDPPQGYDGYQPEDQLDGYGDSRAQFASYDAYASHQFFGAFDRLAQAPCCSGCAAGQGCGQLGDDDPGVQRSSVSWLLPIGLAAGAVLLFKLLED